MSDTLQPPVSRRRGPGLLGLYGDDIEASLQRWARNPGPPTEGNSFSLGSFLASGLLDTPRGAAIESGGNVADFLSAFGTAVAASGGTGQGMFSVPTPDEAKQEAEARERMLKSDAFDVTAGNAMRRKAEEFYANPETSHQANVIFSGVMRPLTKAVAQTFTLGPIAGPVVFGLDEGNTAAQNLRAENNVDAATAAKVGAVVGATSAVSAALPAGGSTLLRTIGLAAAGGPATFIAQETLTRNILQEAGRNDIASMHDPLDPLGLSLSTIVPLAVGGVHLRGLKARQEKVEAGGVPLAQLTRKELESLPYNDRRLDQYAAQAAERHGVPPGILLGIKNAGERSGSKAVSPKGAQGVMQFMPATAKEMGITDPTDPLQSIDGAARYMRKLHDAYGSWDAAIAHYNGGGSQAALVRSGGKPSFPETAAYLDRVMKYADRKTVKTAAADYQVVDAVRVKALDDALSRSLPSTDDAQAEVMRASDLVADGRISEAVADIPPVHVSDTPEFQSFFSRSFAVVDETGREVVFYRGLHQSGIKAVQIEAPESGARAVTNPQAEAPEQRVSWSTADTGRIGPATVTVTVGRPAPILGRWGPTSKELAFELENLKRLEPGQRIQDAEAVQQAKAEGHDAVIDERGDIAVFTPEAARRPGGMHRGALHFQNIPRHTPGNTLPDTPDLSGGGEAKPAREDAGVEQSKRLRQLMDERPGLQVKLPNSDETLSVEHALLRAHEQYDEDTALAELVKVAAECALMNGV